MIVNKKHKDKKIARALKAFNNAETEWAKKYWYNVWKQLCLEYNIKTH